jgi:hypothetical protein
MLDKIRQFDSGATRDTAEGKLSYVKALSPIVLQRYVQYLDVHRKQSDGSMREFDNWKQGIPEETYLDGLGRHFVAAWLLAQDYPASDNHGPVTLEDSLCAIIFGASGWLHEILKKDKKFVVPAEWDIAYIDPGGQLVCGWYIYKKNVGHLHKDFQLHDSTGWRNSSRRYGEAPGYWPTEADAEVALQQYLGEEKL